MIARIALEAERPLFMALGAGQVEEQKPEGLTFSPARWSSHFDAYLDEANPTVWLAFADDGRCVGYAMATAVKHLAADETIGALNFLYVRPDVRGSAAGGRAALALFSEFEAWCDRVGAGESVVGSTAQTRRDIPMRFYARFGYGPVGAMRKARR